MKQDKLEKATFGAGCFWGVEEAFRKVTGVVATRGGFLGGNTKNPSYEDVCSGKTGHTEVVEVSYDPARIAYDDLVHIFWNIHDPTFEAKAQYQSVIFYHTPEQEAVAKESKERVQKSDFFQRQLLTMIVPVQAFYEAEEYHQRFFQKRAPEPSRGKT
jgi:peptide-methionine (S)-S-oxide reductase